MDRPWLPEPAAGTPIGLGFDGADSDDWSAIRAETRDGFQFTPRYGPDRRPTIWIPAQWGGRIPRDQISIALEEIHDRFKVARGYYDPWRYETDIETWALKHDPKRVGVVTAWDTGRTKPMHEALERFRTDLSEGRIRHDGCPLTWQAILNARKLARSGDRYIIEKPSQTQKIDPAMASVMAHEAASDERATGWPDPTESTVLCFA